MHNSKKILIAVVAIIIIGMMGVIGKAMQSTNEAPKTNSVTTVEAPQEPKEETKRETKREEIPYEKKTISDDNLEYGKTEIRTVGQSGTKAYSYDVTYVDGKEVSRKLVDERVEKEPIAEVTAKGTRILWHCVDATSYDRNPYNDNKCTSSTGEVRYLSDYQAEALDTTYRAGKAGAYYYNNK